MQDEELFRFALLDPGRTFSVMYEVEEHVWLFGRVTDHQKSSASGPRDAVHWVSSAKWRVRREDARGTWPMVFDLSMDGVVEEMVRPLSGFLSREEREFVKEHLPSLLESSVRTLEAALVMGS